MTEPKDDGAWREAYEAWVATWPPGVEVLATEDGKEHFRAGFLARTASPPISATGGGEVRYYLDCEFNGAGGELLSMALRREGGGGLYWINGWPQQIQDSWVATNVIPILRDCEAEPVVGDLSELAAAIEHCFLAWGDLDPIIVTDWPDDIKYFAESVLTGPGTMIRVRSLRFEMHRADAYPTTLPGAVQHNAWWDALALEHLLRAEVAVLQPGGASAAPEGWVKRAAASIAHMVDEWTQRGWNDEGRAKFAALIERRLNRFAAAPSPPAASAEPHRNEVCINCGNTQDIGALTAAGYVSCCPERDMRPSNEFRHQGAASAEDKS